MNGTNSVFVIFFAWASEKIYGYYPIGCLKLFSCEFKCYLISNKSISYKSFIYFSYVNFSLNFFLSIDEKLYFSYISYIYILW